MRSVARLISLIICILTFERVYSQELTFEESTHDFGTIAEDGGEVAYIFKYTNSGESPAVIVTASSSCGCTVPSFSRQPIATGESSTIKVVFDPKDRPGKFSKSVQIIVAPDNKRYQLTIKGNVTPRKKSISERYPFDMGNGLRLGANFYALSNIGQGEVRRSQVSYINDSRRDITIELTAEEQSGVLEIDMPTRIAAGEEGTFEIRYNLEKHPDLYGALNDKLYVNVNGNRSKYRLIINGHGIDNFSDEERSAPPISSRSKNLLRLGNVKRGGKSSRQSFTLENSGVSDLIIRNVDLGRGIECNISRGDVVKAGAKRSFDVWFNNEEPTFGEISRYLTLTLNDPDEPVQKIRVVTNVTE